MKKLNILLLVVLMCCNKRESFNNQKESPLATVVKLISAESMGYAEVAKLYIDLKKVYSKHVNDSIDYNSLFSDQIKFMSKTTKSNKTTNHFKYFNYNIMETIKGKDAKVRFESKDTDSSLKRIIYTLEDRNDNWIVVDIEYIR